MSEPADKEEGRWSEQRVEQAIGTLLRVGVVVSALVVLLGAVIYLWRHGGDLPDYRSFHGEPQGLRQPAALMDMILALKGRGVIQLGLLLLIATPVLRVAFAAYAFARQRDGLYVVISLIVLGVLMSSLFIVN